MSWKDVKEFWTSFAFCAQPVSISLETHRVLWPFAEKYDICNYDALVASAALGLGGKKRLFEDLQIGQSHRIGN